MKLVHKMLKNYTVKDSCIDIPLRALFTYKFCVGAFSMLIFIVEHDQKCVRSETMIRNRSFPTVNLQSWS